MDQTNDPYCLRPGEAAELLTGHPWRRLVVLGDSVAEGLCEPVPGYSSLSWADQLAAALAVPTYLNLGVAGLRAHEIREGQLGSAVEFGADLAVVVGGGNDAFGARYEPERVDRELGVIVEGLQAGGADVVTLGMFDISASPAVPEWLRPGLRRRWRELSERTEALARRLGTIHVRLTDHPVSGDPTLYSSDGRHGTARSDAIAVTEIIRELSKRMQG